MGNSVKLPNNIFARNLRVSFGYSLENIKNEQIQLVTAQSKTYNATSNLEEIKKKVEIR
jgi:hypothetical protein